MTRLTSGVRLTDAQVAELHARYQREAVPRTEHALESFGEWLERTGQEHVRRDLPLHYGICMDCGALSDSHDPWASPPCDKHLAEERMAQAAAARAADHLPEVAEEVLLNQVRDLAMLWSRISLTSCDPRVHQVVQVLGALSLALDRAVTGRKPESGALEWELFEGKGEVTRNEVHLYDAQGPWHRDLGPLRELADHAARLSGELLETH